MLFLTVVKSEESELNPGIKSENLEMIKSIANIRADSHKKTKKVSKLKELTSAAFVEEQPVNKHSLFLKLSMVLDNTNHYRRYLRKKGVL